MKIPLSADQQLPVVRVCEISSEKDVHRWLVEEV